MDGDYLELSQFPCNSHTFPYNSYPSPFGTTRFLTSGIRAIDIEMIESITTYQVFMEFYFKGGDLFW